MRTFVEIRKYSLSYRDLAKKINEIESRVTKGEQTDQKIIEILNQLMAKDETSINKIGFVK
jgi:ribosome-binding protein aMBF1 (putative translation factor)